MSDLLPRGFRFAGIHCGIKQDAKREDLALVVSDVPASAAGVYTKNLICAAPVDWDRQRTPGAAIRAVVVNSGNANACTGQQGAEDNREIAQITADACGTSVENVLVMSTGIIGEYLPMECLRTGIPTAAGQLVSDSDSLLAVARGLMTTDTVHKLACRSVATPQGEIRIAGVAKGSGMIAPDMATMLGLVMTDAALESEVAQQLLAEICDRTFNCITVDGHTSTNDTVLFLANGQCQHPVMEIGETGAFAAALEEVCGDLARAIAADGEGATHLVTIDVGGCRSIADARQIAKTIAQSPLVKTAITGADPNWGRIVSAAGYSGISFDPKQLDVSLNGTPIYGQGVPIAFDASLLSESMRNHHETKIGLRFGEGQSQTRFWTCDLTADYVRINADYHT
ncbi:MAG: bifunctional ornithine acetyltransferase/N-acetylglutamate synthase [Planctomycetaceae bacterium]|nr:bifunctional ornithine acetyltransferase/N-acetylglutamate synthase [Planctomycetaceae bacterium]MBP63799.1 bifunctional ornithine acetyltransferase/N-acetylglutamate synthase [Planctomycetaceae bacterium]